MHSRFASCVVLLAVFAFVGCGGGKAETPSYTVKGTVTLDGEPLSEGEIMFLSPEAGEFDILMINGGKYEGQVKVGTRRVEIRAYRMGEATAPPDMEGYQMEATQENYLPDKYNVDSTLSANVTADGDNTFDFEVTSE